MVARFDPPLNPATDIAELRLSALLRDAWLRRKTDRPRRLGEHWTHIENHLPELLDKKCRGTGKVIDIGPGPGEFLEICRHLGHPVQGIDAPNGRGGMGDEYLEYSRLMVERQKIPVHYMGVLNCIFSPNDGESGSFLCVNSRGSIEQAFAKHMIGEPHDLHHDCRKMAWGMSAGLQERLDAMFAGLARLLIPGGLFLIVANGASNADEYDAAIVRSAKSNGCFELMKHEPPTIHKWRKI